MNAESPNVLGETGDLQETFKENNDIIKMEDDNETPLDEGNGAQDNQQPEKTQNEASDGNLAKRVEKPEVVWCNKPHTNKTPGHWETIQMQVKKLEESGQYIKIYVNKKLSNEIPGASPDRRPDIMAVRRDGKIDQFEIPSKTDHPKDLYERMDNTRKILGDRAGDIQVINIPKEFLR